MEFLIIITIVVVLILFTASNNSKLALVKVLYLIPFVPGVLFLIMTFALNALGNGTVETYILYFFAPSILLNFLLPYYILRNYRKGLSRAGTAKAHIIIILKATGISIILFLAAIYAIQILIHGF